MAAEPLKKKQRLLETLVESNRSSLSAEWKTYSHACKHADEKPKDLLTDESLYDGTITLEMVQDRLKEECINLQKRYPELFNQEGDIEEQKKNSKRRRLDDEEDEDDEKDEEESDEDDKVCVCGCKRMFFLCSKACDGNRYQAPGGVEREGYMCSIPNITDSDGVNLHFCVNCGRIYGFDRDAVQKAIDEDEEENSTDEDG